MASSGFENWTPEMVAVRNANVAKAKQIAMPPGSVINLPNECVMVDVTAPTLLRGETHDRKSFTIHTDPVPAPRMTRSDKWKKRDCVERYFDYRNLLKETVGALPSVPDELHCVFYFEMPNSWSRKKCAEMLGKPHRQRGDVDNTWKGVADALFEEDCAIWKASQEKYWAEKGRVEIVMVWRL